MKFVTTHAISSPLLASLALTAICASTAGASIIVTLPTASVTGSIEITNDISFTVTSPGSMVHVVLDEWVTSDGGRDSIGGLSISPSFNYSLNGGSTLSTPLASGAGFSDNYNTTSNALTPNDGRFTLSGGIILSPGDIFTIKAMTYTLAANSMPLGFNSQAQQTFTGNLFLASLNLNRLTSSVAVPEPSTAALVSLAGLGLFRRRMSRLSR
jgi:hypothetical protein